MKNQLGLGKNYFLSIPREPPPVWADLEFLRTGDLCRIDAEGLLYVEGRQKDLIIVAGRNIYPQVILSARTNPLRYAPTRVLNTIRRPAQDDFFFYWSAGEV